MAIMQKGWFLSKFLMIHLGSYISTYVARFPCKGDVSQWLYKHWDPGETNNCGNSKISEFQSSRRPNEKSWKNLIPLAPFYVFWRIGGEFIMSVCFQNNACFTDDDLIFGKGNQRRSAIYATNLRNLKICCWLQ